MKRVLLYIILSFILFVSCVIARIDKSAVNTALDFHKEGLLASTSTDVEALNDAVFFFERAVRLQPRNATMWHDLGVAHMRTDNWVNADDCFLASMELSEKKMISRGSSKASVKRAESIYKSAKDNRAEIAVFLDATNKNNQANLFTSSSSSRGVAGVKDQFKFARSYSRLLSGRSVGVADGLADEFDDDNFDADADNNEEVYQEFGAFLLCFRREQRHIYSTYSNSPLISVIPSAFLFSSPNPLYQAQSIPSLIRLHELNSWQTVRRRKVEETRDEVSRKGRWWQAWTPSYLAKHYGHLIVSAHTQVGRLNLDKNCSSEMMKQLILPASSSSSSTSSLSMIRMTLVEANDEIEILSKMVSQRFTSKTREQQVRIDNHLDISTNSLFFKSRLLYRLGFSSTIQSLLSSHQDNNTGTIDELVKSPRNTLIPSVLMDVGLPLDEWSHITHELGKLPPLLGRDRDDPVLSCLIRMSIPNEIFEQVDFSTLSAATFPIVSEFIIWTKWRRLMMVTPGGQAVNIGYIDKENEEGEKEKFDKNNVTENITLQKKESSLGEWHLQIAGTSRWTLCQRVTNDTFSPLNEPSLNCVKTLVTGGEIVYIPHDWIVLSTVTTESPVASIFLSGRVFITTMEKEKRGNGESLLRRELKRLEDLCKREIEMEEVPRVSYQVCQLLYKASRNC